MSDQPNNRKDLNEGSATKNENFSHTAKFNFLPSKIYKLNKQTKQHEEISDKRNRNLESHNCVHCGYEFEWSIPLNHVTNEKLPSVNIQIDGVNYNRLEFARP